MATAPCDPGFAAQRQARYGLIFEAWAGGSGIGEWVVVDRVEGCKTAYRMFEEPRQGERMRAERLDRLRDLVADANRSDAERQARARAVA